MGTNKADESFQTKIDRECRLEMFSAIERYLSRAWVTQEMALAHYPLKLLGYTTEINVRWIGLFERSSDRPAVAPTELWSFAASGHRYPKGLYSLIALNGNKNCSILRDRIYSILSLCGQDLQLQVDYDIPDTRLFRNILEAAPNPSMHGVLGEPDSFTVIHSPRHSSCHSPRAVRPRGTITVRYGA